MRRRLGLAGAVLVTLSGCSDGREDVTPNVETSESSEHSASPSEETSVSAEPEELTDAQIKKYLEDILSQNPRRAAQARKMTVPGSVADRYAAYRLAVSNSNLDGGYPLDPWSISMGSEEAEACNADRSVCFAIADFESKAGKLAAFTVNGKDLEERLVQGNDKVVPVAGVGTVQFLAGYHAVTDGALVVAVRLVAGPDGLSILDSYYRAQSGRQSASENISGPPDLGPKSSATYTMSFPNAQPGGTASLRVYVNGGAPVPVSVSVR